MEIAGLASLVDYNFYYTSNAGKQKKINELLRKFNDPVHNSYNDLVVYVRNNFEELATLRNPLTNTVNQYLWTCDPATTVQEAIILLAMKRFSVVSPNDVQHHHIQMVIFDLLHVHDKAVGCLRYGTVMKPECDLLKKIGDRVDFSEGMSAWEKRFQKKEISVSCVQSIDSKPTAEYQHPITISMALRPLKKYSNKGVGNTSLRDTTANISGRDVVSEVTVQGVWESSHQNGIPTVPYHLNIGAIAEVRIGDTNGNIILDIHQLIHTGVLRIKDHGQYLQMMKRLDEVIYPSSISASELSSTYSYKKFFPTYLDEALELNPDSTATVLYLGDRINDKVGNDMYVLDLTTFLGERGVDCTILASNHDLEAVRAYLKLKDMGQKEASKLITEAATTNSKAIMHSVWSGFTSCMQTLHDDPKLYERYQKGMENYIKHMAVYQFWSSSGLLCGHAPPSENSINSIAKKAGMENADGAELNLKVTLINWWFQTEVLQNSESFDRYYPDVGNVSYIKFPLYSATSGTGCHCGECNDIRGNWNNEKGRNLGVRYEKPQGASYVEHGHIFTPQHLKDDTTITTLDSEFGCDPYGKSGQLFLDRVFGNHKVGITMRDNANTI